MADFENIPINGTAEDLEKLLNMDIIESISEDSSNNDIPTAASVYNLFKETIDDSKISYDYAWSSKNTVDKLCPSFSESGAVVTCEPVEGYPLSVVSHIEPVQFGTGDPSPDNIRPVSGHSAVNLLVESPDTSSQFTATLPHTSYGGYVDWVRKKYVQTHAYYEITGRETAREVTNSGIIWYYLDIPTDEWLPKPKSDRIGICSHLKYGLWGNGTIGISGGKNVVYKQYEPFPTLGDFFNYCVSQYTNGTPVQLVYELAEPIEYDLADLPEEILALAGTNTIFSSTGNTDVSGKADPNVIIQDLYNKLNTLSATMAALTGV